MSVVEGDLNCQPHYRPSSSLGPGTKGKKLVLIWAIAKGQNPTKQNKTLLHCVIVTHRLYSGGAEQLLANCLGLKTDPVSVTYSIC